MKQKSDRTLDEIHKNQAALRKSIDEARVLTERSDELIRQHKGELEQESAKRLRTQAGDSEPPRKKPSDQNSTGASPDSRH